MPAAWPDPRRGVDALKYVGERITGRFANRNIYTLQDLIDYINGHTLAQNRTMMRYVMRNGRNQRCVFRSESRNHRTETKNWPDPWPNPPYNLPNAPASRPGLVPGDFEYCVREYNKCGWEVVESFLRQRADVDQARIPPSPDRDNYCRPRRRTDPGPDWCLRPPRRARPPPPPPRRRSPSPPRRSSSSSTSSEDTMERNVRLALEEMARQQQDNEGNDGFFDNGGDAFREDDMNLEDDEDEGEEEHNEEEEEEVLWRPGDEDPWQAFNIHELLRRQRDEFAREGRELRANFQRRFASDLSDLSTAQRIAYVLWSMSDPEDLAAPDVHTLAELVGVSAPTVRRYIRDNLDRLFVSPRRGRYALREGLFSKRERTFLRRIGFE